MATVVAWLTLPARTMAQGSKGACPSSSAAHPKRGARVCAHPGRKHKAHARSKAKGHHAKHAVGRKKAKKNTNTPAPAGRSQTAAACEDGTDPIQAGEGAHACNDGSEPVCKGGSNVTFWSDGSTPAFACGAGASSSPGSAEPACEDGSAAVRVGDGSYYCDEGSEPTCEDGSVPTLPSDGSTPVCNVT